MSISPFRNPILRSRPFAARTSFFRRAFSSRSDAIVCSGFRERRGAGPDRASDDGRGLAQPGDFHAQGHDRAALARLHAGLPKGASPAAPLRPARKARSLPYDALPRVSSTAAFSLFRLASSCHVSEPARQRDPISARRSSSQRASAASARSYSDRTLHAAHPGAASQGGRIPSSPAASVSAAPKSASRNAIRPTISHGWKRHQSPRTIAPQGHYQRRSLNHPADEQIRVNNGTFQVLGWLPANVLFWKPLRHRTVLTFCRRFPVQQLSTTSGL